MSNAVYANNYVGLDQPLTINATVTGAFDFVDVVSYPCRLRNLSSGEETEYDGEIDSSDIISFDIPGGILDTPGRWRAICGVLRTDEEYSIPCTPIEFTVSEF